MFAKYTYVQQTDAFAYTCKHTLTRTWCNGYRRWLSGNRVQSTLESGTRVQTLDEVVFANALEKSMNPPILSVMGK